jgi:hypothetical protein
MRRPRGGMICVACRPLGSALATSTYFTMKISIMPTDCGRLVLW